MKPTTAPSFSQASAPSHVPRMLLQYATERGCNIEHLCQGLGFAPNDLKKAELRLSHRQSDLLVHRVLQCLGNNGLGLEVGGRQTAVSWGFIGLGMQACATLGEALELAIRYQKHAGALLEYSMTLQKDRCQVLAEPLLFDPDVATFIWKKRSPAPLRSSGT
ncbi:AraC family transcriptional regulator ligand-binding domain-containing protein [Pseudomonas sp. PGPR40]|uniref:AraC family transcriptional regulator ligand-binding domain-containing protein n=1 Tax=Pseudomonas sp. PGPR40 TaxID=2913476 RepID=UPI0022AB2D7F|nr:AraC family transcriptional regulator ligand-binding domain-containing protein [Pseudomonas sp. PGPR40]